MTLFLDIAGAAFDSAPMTPARVTGIVIVINNINKNMNHKQSENKE